MKRLAIAAVLVGVVVLVAGYARAQNLPWKPADQKVPPAGNPQTAPPAGAPGAVSPAGAPTDVLDLEKALKPELYQRAIKPVLYQIEQADKVLGLYEKEMAKPEKERNEQRATSYRENAARFYLAASQKAQQAKKMVPEAENQNAITSQYELPTRNKALEIYANLAADRMEKKDVPGAIRHYQQMLKIDPENALAKEELKKIEALVKANSKSRDTTRRGGSGGKDEDDQNPISRPDQKYTDKNNHDENTPGDYKDRYSPGSKYR